MVLVSQAELCQRKRHEAAFTGLKSVPADANVEHSHRERKTCLEIAPDTMPDALEVAHARQHGKHGLDHHAVIPNAALADLQVRWVTRFAFLGLLVEVRVRQNQHLLVELSDERLERAVMRVGRFAVPGAHLAEAVQDEAQLAAHDPAVVGVALLADLFVAAPEPPRVQKLNAEAVRHAQQGRRREEAGSLALMLRQKTEQACAFGQMWKQVAQVTADPAVEGAAADAFEGEQQAERDGFAGEQPRLRMFLLIWHGVINANKQFCDKVNCAKIYGGHRLRLSWVW